ncbi:MAG: alpha/beta hydrolase [Chloroflexi bacterium]|nr:alpha/beta hydrolase [Chloroflexota bacterium]
MTAPTTAPSLYKTPMGEQAIMGFYDNMLNQWPVKKTTRTISTQHGSTFVVACGKESAPPLILLHGAGSNSAIWREDAKEYSRQYQVYAVDLLGEPGKSAPNRPAWDSPAYAEWLAEVCDALKIERVTLVGISQGAWTALKFAVYQPQRVEKLVLMTPGGVVPDKMTGIAQLIVLSMFGKRGMRRIVRRMFGRQPMPEGIDQIMAVIMNQFKPRMGVLPIFSDDELKRLTMPVFLLGGTDDMLRNMDKIAARLRTLIPHLTVMIIPGAGHALINTVGAVMEYLTG